jgi:hypothetical protein
MVKMITGDDWRIFFFVNRRIALFVVLTLGILGVMQELGRRSLRERQRSELGQVAAVLEGSWACMQVMAAVDPSPPEVFVQSINGMTREGELESATICDEYGQTIARTGPPAHPSMLPVFDHLELTRESRLQGQRVGSVTLVAVPRTRSPGAHLRAVWWAYLPSAVAYLEFGDRSEDEEDLRALVQQGGLSGASLLDPMGAELARVGVEGRGQELRREVRSGDQLLGYLKISL